MSAEERDESAEREPEKPGELQGRLGITLRSRGTIQHDMIEWTRHQERYSEQTYTLAITAYKKWETTVASVPYAVVVRLEDTNESTHVYSAVQNILAGIEIRARART